VAELPQDKATKVQTLPCSSHPSCCFGDRNGMLGVFQRIIESSTKVEENKEAVDEHDL
jgi:hypothetical protein